MGLFGLFGNKKKEKSQNINHGNTNTKPTVDLDHLDPDGGLPWGWRTANKEFTDKIRSEYNVFFQKWLDSRDEDPVTQYAEIKSFVLYMQDVKKLCVSKGECFVYWRDELFADEYLEMRTKEMKHLEANIDQLQAEHERKKNELTDLDERVENTLKEHDGILQSDFVKLFDSTVQDEVRTKLYNMTQEGRLERVKSGRSYILHIKKA